MLKTFPHLLPSDYKAPHTTTNLTGANSHFKVLALILQPGVGGEGSGRGIENYSPSSFCFVGPERGEGRGGYKFFLYQWKLKLYHIRQERASSLVIFTSAAQLLTIYSCDSSIKSELVFRKELNSVLGQTKEQLH